MARSPMRRLFGRRHNSTGLLIASAFALIGAGVVLFVFISGRPGGGGRGGSGEPIPSDRFKVGELPANVGEATDITAVGGTRDASFQVEDKNNPGRIALELLFARMEPIGSGVYQASEPRAWVYMKDGRTIFIRADSGRVRRTPTATTPESGEFTGNGLLLVFAPRSPGPDGTVKPIDPLNDAPGLVGRFEAASFDTVLLEISSQDAWTVETPDVWAAGRGFVVRANQVLERLEFAKIDSGGTIRYRVDNPVDPVEPAQDEIMGPPVPPVAAGGSSETSDDPREAVAAAATPEDLVGPPLPPPPIKEDLYIAEFRDEVELIQDAGDRQLLADLLTVHLRLLDNKLPEGALGGLAPGDRAQTRSFTIDTAPHAGLSPLPTSAALAALVLAQTASPLPPQTINPPAAASALATPPAPPPPPSSPPPPIRRLFTRSDTDVVLTWTGGMVARPINPGPKGGRGPSDDLPELADGNHVHARFTAGRRSGAPERAGAAPTGDPAVRLRDRRTGAVGVCASVAYAATARQLTLESGPAVAHVDFAAPEAGRFIVPNVSINLATGEGFVTGPGALVQLPPADENLHTVRPAFPIPVDLGQPVPSIEEPSRQITWGDRADFRFRVRDGRISDALDSAVFTGSVAARDERSWLRGERLATEFVPRPAPDDRKSALRRVIISGDALAVGFKQFDAGEEPVLPARDAFVASDQIEVRFDNAGTTGSDEPTFASARGSARVADGRGEIRAGSIDARLTTEPDGGDTVVSDVTARGSVVAEMLAGDGGGDTIIARADELHAVRSAGGAHTADLTGTRVELERGPSLIVGTQMRLEESQGRLDVFGEGWLRHVQIADSASEAAAVVSREALDADPSSSGQGPALPPGVSIMRARWTRSMSFTDRTGRGELHGEATVTSADVQGGQIARAQRMLIDITPAAEAQAGAAGPGAAVTLASPTGPTELDGRRLLRAEALGAALESEAGAPASIKSWRFAPASAGTDPGAAPAPREFEQVFYLEGPRIIADEVAGTVTIPDAGRGVTFESGRNTTPIDASAAPSRPATPLAGAGGGAGRSQFTWRGDMQFNRLSGLLTMRREIELRHLPIGSDELIRMVCDELNATFNTRGGKGAELLTAEAVTGVFAESGTRHLIADRLFFDALTGVATARSTTDSPVTMQDTREPAPLLARALKWETRTDRIEITEPMPLTGGMR